VGFKELMRRFIKTKEKGIKRKKNSFPEGNKPKRSVGLKE